MLVRARLAHPHPLSVNITIYSIIHIHTCSIKPKPLVVSGVGAQALVDRVIAQRTEGPVGYSLTTKPRLATPSRPHLWAKRDQGNARFAATPASCPSDRTSPKPDDAAAEAERYRHQDHPRWCRWPRVCSERKASWGGIVRWDDTLWRRAQAPGLRHPARMPSWRDGLRLGRVPPTSFNLRPPRRCWQMWDPMPPRPRGAPGHACPRGGGHNTRDDGSL
jgi:hypothetical protein